MIIDHFTYFIYILGGKPITPNDINDSLLNGNTQLNGHSPENGALAEKVIKTEVCIYEHTCITSYLHMLFPFVSGITESTEPINRTH